ncbi:MerR family transcriptional regulator [Agromyces sp. CFH 90414]|uniref:MerR family transcriptional regulator n=1 Tax=Agromyces agglutinans TaxID=2662258 RepID=A0A6I2F450_9MICO|nr:MerR family transcriptional regulator [Agromyces agglutinans]MRG59372.1 MerR family transcriptional regulator [Agromyces agglutinans]
MDEYTPAQVAEATGFSLDTLRYYEKEGLIGPVERTVGGRRRYRSSDLAWLDLIKCLRDTGMPIADLKRYSRLSEDDSTLAERFALLEAHDRVVQAEIDRLRERQHRLHEKMAWYREQLGG